MRGLLQGCCLLLLLTLAIRPVSAEGLADGLVVGQAPPQASAAALVELPTVYATPGSFWYWLKIVWEDLQLVLAADEQRRAELLLQFSARRLSEGYQAIQNGQPDQAIKALERYHVQQTQLSSSLLSLDQQHVHVSPLLQELKEQLGLQQALEQFAGDEVTSPDQRQKISQLLEVRPVQTYVYRQSHQQYLLGVQDEIPRQATASTEPEPVDQASQSAQPEEKP